MSEEKDPLPDEMKGGNKFPDEEVRDSTKSEQPSAALASSVLSAPEPQQQPGQCRVSRDPDQEVSDPTKSEQPSAALASSVPSTPEPQQQPDQCKVSRDPNLIPGSPSVAGGVLSTSAIASNPPRLRPYARAKRTQPSGQTTKSTQKLQDPAPSKAPSRLVSQPEKQDQPFIPEGFELRMSHILKNLNLADGNRGTGALQNPLASKHNIPRVPMHPEILIPIRRTRERQPEEIHLTREPALHENSLVGKEIPEKPQMRNKEVEEKQQVPEQRTFVDFILIFMYAFMASIVGGLVAVTRQLRTKSKVKKLPAKDKSNTDS